MKRLATWLAAALAAAVLLAGTSELLAQHYLRRRNVERRAEIARIRAVEEAYRRPVIFGEAIDQNAAVWYVQAFAHVPSTLDQQIATILKTGPAGLDAHAAPIVAASCGEMRTPRFQTAVRCVRCDWGFGFGFDSLKGLGRSMEIVNLHHCLTAAGHISARAGEIDQAASDYLMGVGFGCDLGMGDFNMAIIGMDSALRNLKALGELVPNINELPVLDRISGDLARFDHHLPDARAPFLRELLWTENAASLNTLNTSDDRPSFWSHLGNPRSLAALQLIRAAPIFADARRLASMTDRQALKTLAESAGRRSDRSGNLIVRNMHLPHSALVLELGFEVSDAYRATERAIAEQRSRLTR